MSSNQSPPHSAFMCCCCVLICWYTNGSSGKWDAIMHNKQKSGLENRCWLSPAIWVINFGCLSAHREANATPSFIYIELERALSHSLAWQLRPDCPIACIQLCKCSASTAHKAPAGVQMNNILLSAMLAYAKILILLLTMLLHTRVRTPYILRKPLPPTGVNIS